MCLFVYPFKSNSMDPQSVNEQLEYSVEKGLH